MILEESRKRIALFFWLFTAFFVPTFLISGCAAPQRYQPMAPVYTPPPPAAQGIYHTVSRGETLYRIAKNYKMDVSELMRINHITNPSTLEVGQRLFIPRAVTPAYKPLPPRYEPVNIDKIRKIVGPKKNIHAWQTITVHHSATLKGGAKNFDRDHSRRKMGGLFYHFVIGNGSYTSDGAVEVGWRWKKQVKANRPYDIQICMVGDFSRQNMSEAQLSSLANLILVLQEQYGIPTNRVRRHKDIYGKHTECPGRNFPFDRLLTRLRGQ